MSLPPPVPPRPYDYYDAPRDSNAPPPVPPLPPDFHPENEYENDYSYDAQPHYSDPLVAPKPQRLRPDLPADMARSLDEQTYDRNAPSRLVTPQPPPFQYSYSPPQPHGVNHAPGFLIPGAHGVSPAPPAPPQGAWSAPQPKPPGSQVVDNLSSSLAGASISPPSQRIRTSSLHPANAGVVGASAPAPTSLGSSPPSYNAPIQSYASPHQQPQKQQQQQLPSGVPPLTVQLPTIASLSAALPIIQNPQSDAAGKVAWCRDVLRLVNRTVYAASGGLAGASSGQSGTDPIPGPVRITDPALQRLADVAVPLVLQLASTQQTGQGKVPIHIAEAIYLRGVITAAGSFPNSVPANPRTAFRDFEQAARNGFSAGWFRLGRDYESYGNDAQAKSCFERGVKNGNESCIYRMGMAHLMGQLGLTTSTEIALPLLHRAATLSTIDVPQPSYVYGLLLLAEFKHVTISLSLFQPLIPPGSSPSLEARKYIERAAYLGFAPAQYKLGHAYEFALAPLPYDPLLSVQYYSLASQQGEAEADMALSKWFLCGAEGCFEKDEGLAFTFAEKAARKGLPSAEFAMGYYKEVGVGTDVDVEAAKKWYQKAASNGNTDAPERLAALNQTSPQALSRQEHDTLTENKLVRKRTQAKQRYEQSGAPISAIPSRMDANKVMDVIRRNSKYEPPVAYQQPHHSRQPSGPVPGPQYQQPPPSQPPPSQPPVDQPLQRPPQNDFRQTFVPPAQQHPSQNAQYVPPTQHPAHASTLPPSTSTGPPVQGPGIGPRAPRQQAVPPRQRYTLSDAPSPSSGFDSGDSYGSPPIGSPGRRGASPGGRPARGGGRPPPQHQNSLGLSGGSGPAGPAPPNATASSSPSAGGTKYNTFAEMGFQSQKLDEKDCIIM